MTHVLTPKPPADTVAYLIDWRQQLAAEGVVPDAIQSFTLTVTAGTVTIPASQNLGLVVEATISGGADGETATLHCQVVTFGGQTLNRDLSLLVSSTAVAITPETTTKSTILDMAFEECGLADYEFNTTNEEKASALRRLDSLMALWAGAGFNIDLGYNFPPAIGKGNYTDPAGIPDGAVEAVAIHLAARIAPTIGKTLSAETKTALNRSLNALRAQYALIVDRRLPRLTIVGAGQKPRAVWAPFVGDLTVGGAAPNGGAAPIEPLSISGTPNPTVTAGSAYVFNPAAAGGTGALTFIVVNKPIWASFSTVTGQLAGIPSAPEVDAGVQIGVHDSLGIQAWLPPWTITVSAAGTSPSLDFSQPDNSQYIPII